MAVADPPKTGQVLEAAYKPGKKTNRSLPGYGIEISVPFENPFVKTANRVAVINNPGFLETGFNDFQQLAKISVQAFFAKEMTSRCRNPTKLNKRKFARFQIKLMYGIG